MPRQKRSSAVNGTVPNRRENDRLRGGRKHLTETEIEKLAAAARKYGRYGHRDATAILLAFIHDVRVGELVNLQWSQIDFSAQNQEPVCIRWRAGLALSGLVPENVRENRRARENAISNQSAHAPSCLRIQAGECRQGYAIAAGLSWPPGHPIDRGLHVIGTGSVRRMAERVLISRL